MICERPKCKRETIEDYLYCSKRCYNLDNSTAPVRPLARNKIGGFGNGIHLSTRGQLSGATRLPELKEPTK